MRSLHLFSLSFPLFDSFSYKMLEKILTYKIQILKVLVIVQTSKIISLSYQE